MLDVARKVIPRASAVIAVGTCASFGGLPAASPNPSRARGVMDAVGGKVINVPGCPANSEWVLAVVINLISLKKPMKLDAHRRPVTIYGTPVHEQCERKVNFDADKFVETFGNAASAQGYCLYGMGCKGPEAYSTCPKVKWNGGVNWCVQAGAPCMGCVEPNFWDKFAPFYEMQ